MSEHDEVGEALGDAERERDEARAEAERLRENLNALRAHRDRVDYLRRRAEVEVERLRGREAHFARVLGVTDGGQYRNDWDSKITALLAEVERLREQRDSCMAGERFWQAKSDEAASYRAVGDTMQSELSRVSEWVLAQDDVPYEVMQAAISGLGLVQDWTDARLEACRQ